jgi:hypothetical protein
MHFHSYISNRDRFITQLKASLPPSENLQAWVQHNHAEDAYVFAVRQCQHAMDKQKSATDNATKEHYAKQVSLLIAEQQWFRDQRPFYNVWPIMFTAVRSLSLDIPWNKVRFPFYTMMFQFPEGHEPFGLTVAMVATSQGGEDGTSYEQMLTIEGHHLTEDGHYVACRLIPDNRVTISETFCGGNTGDEETRARGEQLQFLLRLACVVSLLADGEDLITPLLLRRDAEKEEEVPPEILQEWIARKAEKAKRSGVYGFDIGKHLQQNAARAPTAIGPYYAIRWTGKGGTIPKAVKVSEHLKNRNPLTSVPTGFLGWESEDELSKALGLEDTPHTVYFLRDGDRPYVKIGFTNGPLIKRLRGLATANRELRLLGIVSTGNGHAKENEIHQELRNTVRDGEFFYLSDDGCRKILIRHGGRWLGD